MSAAKKHLVVSILLMSTALLLSSCAGDPQKAKVKLETRRKPKSSTWPAAKST